MVVKELNIDDNVSIVVMLMATRSELSVDDFGWCVDSNRANIYIFHLHNPLLSENSYIYDLTLETK